MKSLLALTLIVLLTGCASVNICREGKTMADIQNTGWYLFCFLPIASGDANHPNCHTCRLFSDTVVMESNMKLLDYAMRKEGVFEVRNLTSFKDDESVFFFLLKRYTMHTSAELIYPQDELTP